MNSVKRTSIDFASGHQRLLRYTVIALNIATLAVTILFVTWALGKIIAVLHALVFALALDGAPPLAPNSFPLPENTATEMESHPFLPAENHASVRELVTTVQRNGWRQ